MSEVSRLRRRVTVAEIKMTGAEGAGIFEGYAATFGNVDGGGDVFTRGAFAASLEERRPVMLRDHDPASVIGRWMTLEEDERGLRVTGKFARTVLGEETRTLVEDGALDGLSVGYIPRPGGADLVDGVRVLSDVDLLEISVVTFPMNDRAMIDEVKQAFDEDRPALAAKFFEGAARDAGFSAREAKAAASAAVDGLRSARDAGSGSEDPATLRELREALGARFSNL